MMLCLIMSYQQADNQTDSRNQHIQALHGACSSLWVHNYKTPLSSMKNILEKMGDKLSATEATALLPQCTQFKERWTIGKESYGKKIFCLNVFVYSIGLLTAINNRCSFSDLKIGLPLFTLGSVIGALLHWASVRKFNSYVEEQAQKKEALIKQFSS